MQPNMVRVVNKNVHPFEQKFKDVVYKMKPGEGVEMERTEAEEFLGSFSPIRVTADGGPDPRYFKRLAIEEIPGKKDLGPVAVGSGHKCHACSYTATSETDLEEHTKANHLEQLADAEVADKLRTKGKSK